MSLYFVSEILIVLGKIFHTILKDFVLKEFRALSRKILVFNARLMYKMKNLPRLETWGSKGQSPLGLKIDISRLEIGHFSSSCSFASFFRVSHNFESFVHVLNF